MANEGESKWARQQVKPRHDAAAAATKPGEFYNIWYHKIWGVDKPVQKDQKPRRAFRVNVKRDPGETKAHDSSYTCIYFAKGRCDAGANCTYKHKVPDEMDEVRLDTAKDVFGRDRFASDRDDMGGIGSFHRENKTLYVNGIHKPEAGWEELHKVAFFQMSEFGPVRIVKIFPFTQKSQGPFMFVQYERRSSAEFAKEAMMGQSFIANEVLNVRWATEDPNPTAQDEARMEKLRKLIAAVDADEAQNVAPEMMYTAGSAYPQTDMQYLPQAPAQGQLIAPHAPLQLQAPIPDLAAIGAPPGMRKPAPKLPVSAPTPASSPIKAANAEDSTSNSSSDGKSSSSSAGQQGGVGAEDDLEWEVPEFVQQEEEQVLQELAAGDEASVPKGKVDAQKFQFYEDEIEDPEAKAIVMIPPTSSAANPAIAAEHKAATEAKAEQGAAKRAKTETGAVARPSQAQASQPPSPSPAQQQSAEYQNWLAWQQYYAQYGYPQQYQQQAQTQSLADRLRAVQTPGIGATTGTAQRGVKRKS